jgi:hypothetical protein
LRKPFEHLQGIDGLSDMDPDDLRALLDFHGTASDPAQFSEWFTNVAKQSLQENPDGFEEWWKSIGLEMGYDFDGDDTGEESDEAATAGMTREDLEAFYAEKEKEREAKETQAREQDQATQEAAQEIDRQMTEFKESLGQVSEDDWQEIANDVLGLAMGKYQDLPASESVPKAIADYKRLVGRGEEQLVQSKLDSEHEPALSGGATTTGEPGSVSMQAAHEAAKRRFRTGVGQGT